MTAESFESFNEKVYESKRRWHREQAQLPIEEKMRQLIELQKSDLPLLAAHRELLWYEKPWPVDP